LDFKDIAGFIINHNDNHWLCVIEKDGYWYQIDSINPTKEKNITKIN